jgi:hypothetical protein
MFVLRVPLADVLMETFLQAGKIAQVLVQYTVKLIVSAWFEARSNPDQVIDQVTKNPRSFVFAAPMTSLPGVGGVPSSLFQHRTIQYSK